MSSSLFSRVKQLWREWVGGDTHYPADDYQEMYRKHVERQIELLKEQDQEMEWQVFMPLAGRMILQGPFMGESAVDKAMWLAKEFGGKNIYLISPKTKCSVLVNWDEAVQSFDITIVEVGRTPPGYQ